VSNVIEADSLVKHYGSRRALDEFTLEIEENKIFGLLGPNGAGKTTAIEIMLGLRSADEGKVSVLGADPQTSFSSIAPRVGAMLQQGGINPGLKPHEALHMYAQFYPQSENVDELIDLVDLSGVNTTVRRLSGGQAQSLSLAIAVVGKPQLVFLDEPTVGMDPRARRRTWDVITRLRDRGCTVVLTTHLMDEAETLCDEIAIVSKGKIIAQGDSVSLTSSSTDAIDVEFDRVVASSELGDLLKTQCEQKTPNSLRIITAPTPDLFVHIATFAQSKDMLITNYSSRAKSLEDVFIELTAESDDK
jgi:ABC-2 type transport system ATP-binding protein